jgi:hypothetical protein
LIEGAIFMTNAAFSFRPEDKTNQNNANLLRNPVIFIDYRTDFLQNATPAPSP